MYVVCCIAIKRDVLEFLQVKNLFSYLILSFQEELLCKGPWFLSTSQALLWLAEDKVGSHSWAWGHHSGESGKGEGSPVP